MTHHDFDLSEVLEQLRSDESGDLVRQMVSLLYQALIDAEATEVVQAKRHGRPLARTTQRNASWPRLLTTKAGDVEPNIPKLRKGSFFPSVLERRPRIDQALYAVVMEAYVHGVSTRKVDDLVAALGVDAGISKSEVSRICAGLDEEMGAFRTRPLSHLGFAYLLCDATYVKARVGGRVVSGGSWSPRALVRTPAAKYWASPLVTPRTRPFGPSSSSRCVNAVFTAFSSSSATRT